MGSIGRYIFRTTFGAFLMVLVSLTAIIWITQALRDVDLVTSQRQTIFTFIGLTGMIVPLLVLIIAPIALTIAVAYVLNKLSADSEIIVMNASGMSPWRLFRPFLLAAIIVSIMVSFISAYLAPKGLRVLREWVTAVRTDLVTRIVQPGRFLTIENGLTFHIRGRDPSGRLLGVLLDDRRDPKEHATILAQQGEILKNDQGTFLLLQNGSLQRQAVGDANPTIVLFERYAFDLSQFTNIPLIRYSVRERYLWELIDPKPDDRLAKTEPGQFRAELHDRLLAPLYPIVFVLLAYAYLGAPRTTRQSRGLSIVGAIAAVGSLRLIGFASVVLGVHMPLALAAQYIALAVGVAFGLVAVSRGLIIEPPAVIVRVTTALADRFARRTSAAPETP